GGPADCGEAVREARPQPCPDVDRGAVAEAAEPPFSAAPDRVHPRLRDPEVEPGELEGPRKPQPARQRRRDRPGLLQPGREAGIARGGLVVDVVALPALEREVDERAAPRPGCNDDRLRVQLVE